MTADKDQTPRSPTGGCFSNSYASAFVYPGVGSPKAAQQSPKRHPHGPRTQSGESGGSLPNPHSLPVSPTDPDPRQQAGSSRTKYSTIPPLQTSSGSSTQHREFVGEPEALSDDQNTPKSTAFHQPPEAPYRSPEPVYEPPEDFSVGYVQDVVQEHPGSDDELHGKTSPFDSSPPQDVRFDVSTWQREVRPDMPANIDTDNQDPERPQLGSGSMPRRVGDKIHEHNLYRLTDIKLPPRKLHGAQLSVSNPLSPPPVPAPGTSAGTDAELPNSPPAIQPQSTGTIDEKHVRSLAEVKDSLPGGADGIDQWYFCWQCCVWYRISMSRIGLVDGVLKGTSLDWDSVNDSPRPEATQAPSAIDEVNPHRGKAFLRDVEQSRKTPSTLEQHIHFHEMRSSNVEPSAHRLERIEVREEYSRFVHLIPGMESEIRPNWHEHAASDTHARLFLCCGSQASILVDSGPVAGQIPAGLMRSFVSERQSNPVPGETDVKRAVKEAIELLITLLGNPLFKGQRGWIRLDNKRVMAKLGSSMATSVLLYMIGFGCKEEDDVLRVGPLSQRGEDFAEEQVLQQDRYMMRTWVELNLFLHGWLRHNKLDPVPEPDAFIAMTSLASDIDVYTDNAYLPIETPHKELLKTALTTLGVARIDSVNTILAAYAQQKACDAQNIPTYLDALEQLSQHVSRGQDELAFQLSVERSMGHYTLGDLKAAYDLIGYTSDYANIICVEPDEAPDDEILKMHRDAFKSASNPAQRTELGYALRLIGRHRRNSEMKRLGSSGESLMTADEAFEALSAPKESVDDGLIMQYELAVDEYPRKRDYYRTCLEVISQDAGDSRPMLKRFLETGSAEAPVVKRNDIPVGLQNIGNTCYLNSILQYLYSIKPLRDAVLTFGQDDASDGTAVKPEVERSKRFVRQLRLLFLQLYKSESTSVRPDEELAYLAITRPEQDRLVEPVAGPGSILASLPTVGSPSSTRVNTPSGTRPSSPVIASSSPSRGSVLGKRASEDRDSNGSPKDRPKRSDRGVEDDLMSLSDHEGTSGEDFEMVSKPSSPPEGKVPAHPHSNSEETVTNSAAQDRQSEPNAPTSGGVDLQGLNLTSPAREIEDPIQTVTAEQPRYAPPPGPPPPLPPRPARRDSKATLNQGLQFGLQQDSAEVLINVLSQLETAFEPPANADGSKGRNLIADLFSCQFRQQLVYQTESGSIDAQTPASAVFVHPIIGVEEEGKDLYDCLAELYLRGDEIVYEGKKGHMMALMDRFPPMLYIQMRRSQFDHDTGRERKTNTHVPFAQTMAMDRFLATADPDKRQQSVELARQMSKLRTRLHELQKQKPLSVTATFDHLRKSLASLQSLDSDLDITDDFLPALDAEREQVQKDINEIEAAIPALRAKMNELWANEHACEYELVSVFMHRGRTSGAGHYWTYQSNLPDHSDRFFKYNDETVTEVPASEVLQDRTGSDANPALLCYVRTGQGLVETLHREVFEQEQARNNDTSAPSVADAQVDVDMQDQQQSLSGPAAGPNAPIPPADVEMSDSASGQADATAPSRPLIDLDDGDDFGDGRAQTRLKTWAQAEDLLGVKM